MKKKERKETKKEQEISTLELSLATSNSRHVKFTPRVEIETFQVLSLSLIRFFFGERSEPDFSISLHFVRRESAKRKRGKEGAMRMGIQMAIQGKTNQMATEH
ncbi:MAG: hypothetical protein Q8P67_06920 [archaeon]|nr:hypothetical protein [archaeon]